LIYIQTCELFQPSILQRETKLGEDYLRKLECNNKFDGIRKKDVILDNIHHFLTKPEIKDTKLPIKFTQEDLHELFIRNKDDKRRAIYDPGPNSYNPNYTHVNQKHLSNVKYYVEKVENKKKTKSLKINPN